MESPRMSHPAWSEKLDRLSGPLYRQAAAHLRAAILGGDMRVGVAMPTEADLAERFGISLITIRAALRELEGEGWIRKRAAKTALVVRSSPRAAGGGASNGLDGMIAALAGARLEVMSFRPARSAEAARLLGLDGRGMMPCLRGTLLRGDAPLGEVVAFYGPELGAQLKRAEFDGVTGLPTMAERLGLRIGGAGLHLAAAAADAGLAASLGCAEGAPVVASRIAMLDTGGGPLEVVFARLRGDRFNLDFEVSRG
jgi:GntR family transcriptional regulator